MSGFTGSRGGRRQVGFGTPTARAALEKMAMMEQTIEHGADGGRVTHELAPVLYGPVRSHDGTARAKSPHLIGTSLDNLNPSATAISEKLAQNSGRAS